MLHSGLNYSAFSSTGEYFCVLSHDGRLKIWETSTNSLKQEFIPSSHLSTTSTCLAWKPQCQRSRQSNKRKKSQGSTEHIVALGTVVGNVLIYSVTQGDLVAKLEGGHNDAIHGLSWCEENGALYTCSSDKHVVKWDVDKKSVGLKWKADSRPIYSVCVLNDKRVLTASSFIKLWDAEHKTVLKKFSGHATEVTRLFPVNINTSEGLLECFLSGAVGENVFHAWNLNCDDSSLPLTSFCLPEDPSELLAYTSGEQSCIGAISRNGSFYYFEHSTTPVEPVSTVGIVTDEQNIVDRIPILGAQFANDSKTIRIAFGNFLACSFEELSFENCKPEIWLVRQLTSPSAITLQKQATKLKQPTVTDDAKLLTPGSAAPQRTLSAKKDKKKLGGDVSQVTLEERLAAIHQSKDDSHTPNIALKADNYAHLLLQGIQSKDVGILNSVLYRANDEMISNTVRRLPVQSVIPLLKELHLRFHHKGRSNLAYIKWTKHILQVHMSYLMTCQEIDEVLGPINQLLEARTQLYSKLSRLQGKLDLVLSQVTSKNEPVNVEAFSQNLLVYQDVSSDESVDLNNELMQTQVESEDNWSESSDKEAGGEKDDDDSSSGSSDEEG